MSESKTPRPTAGARAAGAGGRHRLSRLGFGAAADMAGELVFNTAHHRLPGGPHRSLVPRPDRADDRARDRQRRRQPRGLRVRPALLRRLRGARAVAAGLELARDQDLGALMAEHGVAGISGIDTRAITRRMRIGGAQRAVITRAVDDPARAVEKARRHPSLEGPRPGGRGHLAQALRVDRRAVAGARQPPEPTPPGQAPRGRLRLRHQARHPAPACAAAAAGSRWCRPRPPPRTSWP